MRVLLTEAEPGDAIAAALVLGAAGHTVRYCHPPQHPDAVCGAVADRGRCPLLHDDADVVVDVRSRPVVATQREQGAVCAVQHGTPLVICGQVVERSEMLARADVRCDSVAELEQACEEATRPTSPTARRAVAAAARRVLASRNLPPPSEVRLRPGRLVHDVVITLQAELPARERQLVQCAVRSALMAYTPMWLQVQVVAGMRTQVKRAETASDFVTSV